MSVYVWVEGKVRYDVDLTHDIIIKHVIHTTNRCILQQ